MIIKCLSESFTPFDIQASISLYTALATVTQQIYGSSSIHFTEISGKEVLQQGNSLVMLIHDIRRMN